MKNTFQHYLLFSLLLASQSLLSQNKPHIYLDESRQEISREDYYGKSKIALFILKEVENDSTIEHLKIPRQIMGFFNDIELAQVKTNIEQTVNDSINSDNIIILNFFKTKRSGIKHYTKDQSYINRCQKKENISQFFITKKGYKFQKVKAATFEDKIGIIERLFFSNPNINCGYIIIKPDGYYYVYLGEYQQSKILERALKDWE